MHQNFIIIKLPVPQLWLGWTSPQMCTLVYLKRKKIILVEIWFGKKIKTAVTDNKHVIKYKGSILHITIKALLSLPAVRGATQQVHVGQTWIQGSKFRHAILGFDIPQLHAALSTAEQNFVQVSAWVHHASDSKSCWIKLHVQIDFYKWIRETIQESTFKNTVS